MSKDNGRYQIAVCENKIYLLDTINGDLYVKWEDGSDEYVDEKKVWKSSWSLVLPTNLN